MTTVEQGQVWEMYSATEQRWLRVVVTKIEDGKAMLRYEGILEFTMAEIGDMQNSPELFRPPVAQRSELLNRAC